MRLVGLNVLLVLLSIWLLMDVCAEDDVDPSSDGNVEKGDSAGNEEGNAQEEGDNKEGEEKNGETEGKEEEKTEEKDGEKEDQGGDADGAGNEDETNKADDKKEEEGDREKEDTGDGEDKKQSTDDEEDEDGNKTKKTKKGGKEDSGDKKAKHKKGDDDDDGGDADAVNDDQNNNGEQNAEQGEEKPNTWPFDPRLRCQDKEGNMEHIATVCPNQEDDKVCEAIFPSDPDNPDSRPRNCDILGAEEMVKKCAKHCKTCCELKEHGCGDDPTSKISCLSQSKENCELLNQTMIISCASSCGMCNIGPCRDKIDGCISFKHKCHDSDMRDELKKNCARTCGSCSVKCHDKSSMCSHLKKNCLSKRKKYNKYKKSTRKVCKRSCGLCPDQQHSRHKHKLKHHRHTDKEEEDEDEEE